MHLRIRLGRGRAPILMGGRGGTTGIIEGVGCSVVLAWDELGLGWAALVMQETLPGWFSLQRDEWRRKNQGWKSESGADGMRGSIFHHSIWDRKEAFGTLIPGLLLYCWASWLAKRKKLNMIERTNMIVMLLCASGHGVSGDFTQHGRLNNIIASAAVIFGWLQFTDDSEWGITNTDFLFEEDPIPLLLWELGYLPEKYHWANTRLEVKWGNLEIEKRRDMRKQIKRVEEEERKV